ncbi:Universal bacterial protein YeaZ [uncultured Desulfatiglans sp.]|nr:Universal bacterial protein YeaZ [uncultured Desulfatiglans sp.]
MLLAVDTSTTRFSMAIMDLDGSIVAEYSAAGDKNRFVHLMPALNFLLESAQIGLREVRCLGVALGPGSFTGLRVGLALTKGLAHALGIPLVGVPSLMAVAAQAPPTGLPVMPLLDSRRGEFFTALFKTGGDGDIVRLAPDRAVKADNLPVCFNDPVLLIGNDFRQQASLAENGPAGWAIPALPHLWGIRAAGAGRLALKRFLSGDTDDPWSLTPIYLRPPDIRPPAEGPRVPDSEGH